MIKSSFVNYAHRGASSYAPENTFASFYKGIILGANGIETDIQSTRDGVLVLHHDDTLTRICGLDKKVSDLTLKELRELDFGCYFSDKYAGEKIVTLIDFLTYFSSKNISFALEIKQESIEEEAYDIANRFLSKEQYFFTSFSLKSVLKLAKTEYSPRLGYLSQSFDLDTISELLENNVEQYCPFAPELNESQMQYLRSKEFNVRAWGVANEEIMKQVYLLGVDGMTVNFPDKLYNLINDK